MATSSSPASPPVSGGFLELFTNPQIRAILPIVFTCMTINMVGLVPSTSINVGLNDMMASLGMDLDFAQWIATGWLAATTVTMLMTDYLVRKFGIKKVLQVGMIVYAVTALIGGLAPTAEILVASRIAQGAVVGPISPATMMLVFMASPIEHRGKTMGLMAVGVILAPTFAPTIAGHLIEQFDWRLIFLATIPMALLCLPAIQLFIPEGKPPSPPSAPPVKLDVAGSILMTCCVFIGLLGASWGSKYGWRSPQVEGCLLLSLLSFLLFIFVELSVKQPLVNLRIFRTPRFTLTCIISLVMGLGLYGSSYLTPLFVQSIMGLPAIESGELFILPGMAMAIAFPLAGWVIDRSDAKWVLIPGLLLTGASNFFLSAADHSSNVLWIVFLLLIGRIGMGAIMPALTVVSLSSVPPEDTGQASGISNYTRQLGGALGINILSVHLGLTYLRSLEVAKENINWGSSATKDAVVDMMVRLDSMGLTQWDTFGAIFGWIAGQAHTWALTEAFRLEFYHTGIAFIICIPLAFFVNSKDQQES